MAAKKILIFLNLLLGNFAIGMQSHLDLLPVEISVEIAQYYVASLYEYRTLMCGWHPNNGVHLGQAIEIVKKFYELHPTCKAKNPEITKVLVGHVIENFRVDSLDRFKKIINGIQEPIAKPIFAHAEIKDWIMEHQKRIAQDELFDTDLYEMYFKSDKINALLALGVDVNARSPHAAGNNCTPLMLACRAGNVLLITSLLKAGADVTLQDDHGQTAISYVPSFHLDRFNIIRTILVQAGADATQPRFNNW